MGAQRLFVAATRQHVGKTTVSLALMSGLQKRYGKVGFIKPVGQQHEVVDGVKVDKDVSLMKEFFKLTTKYEDMSPVLIPRGYTRDFIDGKIAREQQLEALHQSITNVEKECDAVVLEGTGHTAVGSVVNLNNAQVAKELGCGMIMVTPGGLGSAFDELELNRCTMDAYGVPIAGVIFNKVLPAKLDMVTEYTEKLIKRWDGVPVLGVVPDEPYLGRPSLHDLEKIFGTKVMGTVSFRKTKHYSVDHTLMVATRLDMFLRKLQEVEGPLVVTHCSRTDIILGFLAHAQKVKLDGQQFTGALVLSGTSSRTLDYVLDLLTYADLPVLHSRVSTFKTMDAIRSYTPKLHKEDMVRAALAVKHYEPYIDFDRLPL